MPNVDEICLAKYRIEKARDCIKASKLLLDEGMYKKTWTQLNQVIKNRFGSTSQYYLT